MFMQLKCRFFGLGVGFCIQGGSPSRGGSSIQGGSPFGGVLHPGGGGFSIQGMGGSPSWGVLHPGGFSIWGGSPSRGAGGWFSIWGGSPSRGVLHLGGFSIWGVYHVTYPIMHLMLPVCCLHTNWDTPTAPAYILPGHVTCNASWDTQPPPPPPVDRQTPVKT